MSVPYVGKSEYCFSNSLNMVLAAHPVKGWAVPAPGRIECLTTMPFGVFFLRRSEGSMFLFSPGASVNPDKGIDFALRALGWECETFVGSAEASVAQGFERLRQAVREGPALVGPMDLGGFAHNPNARYLRGADHFVVAYAVDNRSVSFHDPYGYPHAWLPASAFLKAWKTGGKEYRRGPYTMRWNFRPTELATSKQAILRTLPKILPAMTSDPGGPVAFGSVAALERFLKEIKKGVPDDLRGFLTYFSIPLGSRRRSDAAQFAADAGLHELAEVFTEQSQLLGRAQLAAVQHRDRELAKIIGEFRDLEASAIRILQREYG